MASLLLSSGFGWFAVPAFTFAQDPPSIEERLSDPVYMAWVAEPSVAACIQCHVDGPGLAVLASGNLTPFSRRQEMDAWISHDKHSIARRRVEPFLQKQQESELIALMDLLDRRADNIVQQYAARGIRLDRSMIGLREVPREWIGMSNVLSRRICDKLWGEGSVETEAGYDLFRRQCLSCHGAVASDARHSPKDDDSDATSPAGRAKTIGIDCVYCHQEGGKAWQKAHFDAESWRLKSPEAKREQGMRDLVDIKNQASLCMDCHVGNRDKDMFVTHQMYAAGHPPLPSNELETFSREMPQHWQSPSELYENLKGFAGRDQYFETNYPEVTAPAGVTAEETFWNTRKLFLGALVARRKVVDLYRQTAASGDWGQYALYDCAACHHDLRSESQRQRRYLTSDTFQVPGRPRPPEWSTVLLDVAYRLSSNRKLYDRVCRLDSQFARCFDAKPFGAPEEAQRRADDLVRALDEVIAAVEKRPFGDPFVRSVMRELGKTDPSKIVAYDAARQLVWAIEVIAEELQTKSEGLPEPVQEAVMQLKDPKSSGLSLDLPAGRGQFIFPDYLSADFERRANFSPEPLVPHLQAIAEGI